MELVNVKEFPFSMNTAWEMLHKTSSLDIEPGSRAEIISESEWNSILQSGEKTIRTTHYTTTFDEEKKIAVVEGSSEAKREHDYVYLELTSIDENHVSLKVDIVINIGLHVFAHLLEPFMKKHAHDVIANGIFDNFEALCEGKETHYKSPEELKNLAAERMGTAFNMTKEEVLDSVKSDTK